MRAIPVRLLAALFLLKSVGAAAMGLLQAYELALQNDPTYLSALHENEAGQQNLAMGRSRLLPNLSLDYQQNRNLLNINSTTGINTASQQMTYLGQVTTLSMRQPLFNLADYAAYRQGEAQANYSSAQFSDHSQDLVLRVVQAYTDALYAGDQLSLVEAQLSAYQEQMHANEIRYRKGDGTITDLLETRSKYAQVQAQLIEAQNQVEAQKRTLSGIVGKEVASLSPLADKFTPLPLKPAEFRDWQTIALAHNADISSKRYAVEASHREVQKDKAGHLPQLDLVASVSKNNQGSIYTFNQDMYVRSIGVEMNMPIYAGGYVTALSRQAAANFERAQSDLAEASNKVMVDLFKQYGLVLSSTSRIGALEKAVDAASLLVKATRKSIKGGERVNLDLLDAQAQYYEARRDLARARYDYLNSFLRLNYDAGILGPDTVRMVAGHFVSDLAAPSP